MAITFTEGQMYLDKRAHGGRKKDLVEKYGRICSLCGKYDERIAAHHSTFNKEDHDHQILLCTSCHAIIHKFGFFQLKKITKDEIERTINTSQTLTEVEEKLGISKGTLYRKRKMFGLVNMELRKCILCGKTFKPIKGTQKRCGCNKPKNIFPKPCLRCKKVFQPKTVGKYCDKCRPIIRKEQTENWRIQNRKRMLETLKNYYRKTQREVET